MDLEEKQKKLSERQERLKALLTAETVQLENELKGKQLKIFLKFNLNVYVLRSSTTALKANIEQRSRSSSSDTFKC